MKNPSKYIGKEREYLEKVLKSENWSSTSGNWTKQPRASICKEV